MAIEFTLHAFHINDYFIIAWGCSVLLKQTVMSTSLMANEIHMKPKCVYIKTELHFFSGDEEACLRKLHNVFNNNLTITNPNKQW